MSTNRKAIVIPALNEVEKIATVLAGVQRFGHVFVVDDGSTDATGDIARAAGASVVRHEKPRGYDGALSSGFEAAQKAGYDAVITIDADGQLPVDQIPVFFAKLDEGFGVVTGERPKMPRYAEWLLAALLRASGSVVRDPFCGLKAYRMDLYEERGFFDSYRSFGTDLLIYAIRRKVPIASLPIVVRDRADRSRVGGRLRAEWKLLKAALHGIGRLWLSPTPQPPASRPAPTDSPLIVLQARTSSRRLPAKSLANVRGFPMAILAVSRAATRGDRVILATSRETSDDALAAVAEEYGIECIRGSLEDVLGRYVQAIGNVPDETVVIRLTGDNIVPDGDLIHEVMDEMRATEAEYISLGVGSGLPYGVSVEATYARHLRAANTHASTAYEREHVTPWIRKKFGAAVFDRYASLDLERYRVTVDTLDDLMSILKVFPQTDDPVGVSWRDVVDRVQIGLYQPGANVVGDDLVMGTAQLGMTYGINSASTPTSSEAHTLIREAITNGVLWLDTARAYGNSENVIGEVLSAGWDARCRVVTKLDPLTNWGPTDSPKGVRAAAEASLLKSNLELRLPRLDTVLLHRAQHWSDWGGAIANLLKEWQAEGKIGTLGISVQSPDELAQALADPVIGHIQMPFNILDYRWDACIPVIQKVRDERPLTVHLRSALLQGLLLSDDPKLWARAHVNDYARVREWLLACARDLEQPDIVSLGLNWCRAQSWADGVVVGMDNRRQLEQNLRVFSKPAPETDVFISVIHRRPCLSGQTLDPSQWNNER